MKREQQLSLLLRYHGGLRKNSGRRKIIAGEPSHKPRLEVDARTPLHINIKLIPQAPYLRTPKFMREFARVLANARKRGLRVQQYAIESNHIHLIAEADDNELLKRGMISLKVSIAWALRRIFMFHGQVFSERYYIHLLKTPTEMRNALRYVLFNHARHTKVALFADFYSSVFGFKDPQAFANIRMDEMPPWFGKISQELSIAKSWMQNQGWRRGKY